MFDVGPATIRLISPVSLSIVNGRLGGEENEYLSNKGPISSSVYVQLLCSQIPKAQKKGSQLKQLFALSGSASIKAAREHIEEIDPRHKSCN